MITKNTLKQSIFKKKIRAIKLENILKVYKDNKLNYKLKCPYELLFKKNVFL